MYNIKLSQSHNYKDEINTISKNYKLLVNHCNSIKSYNILLSQIWTREWFNKNGNKVTPKVHKIYSKLDFKPAKDDLAHQKLAYKKATSKKEAHNLKSKINSLKFIINQHQTWCCDFLVDSVCEINNVDVATLVTKLKDAL